MVHAFIIGPINTSLHTLLIITKRETRAQQKLLNCTAYNSVAQTARTVKYLPAQIKFVVK